MENIYQQHGYNDREDYLNSLREEYGELVDILITVLPESEDFDSLITELEDSYYE
jgi:hypothetical protein